MTLAWISLLALALVIVLSCTNRVHPGFLAIALAWVIVQVAPHFGAPLDLKKDVLSGFPIDLFLTLTGVSLLFTQAYLNGTLDRIAHAAVRLCRGNAGLIPWMFFALAAGLAAAGAGNIAAAALLAPTAMTIAAKARIPALLMTILVGHGSLAGALSPVAPTGIIANAQMERAGLAGHALDLFAHNLAANVVVAALAFVLFGGLTLLSRRYQPHEEIAGPAASGPLRYAHWATLAVLGVLLVSVLALKVDVGMGAFAGAVVLALLGAGSDQEAVRKMPWSVILMVCGVNLLTALVEKTGGTRLFADLVVAVSTTRTAPAVLGFVAAVVSVYSSTSGVVLPAFLPMVKDVAADLPGSDPLALALAVIVAGHLVDSSPLSTIGALCIAGADPAEDKRVLFNRVLLWGLAMTVVGALWSLVIYGLLWPSSVT